MTVGLGAASLVAQSKPTDAKASSLATAFIKRHPWIDFPEIPGEAGMSETIITSAKVIRWGQFQPDRKYWPAELCVTLRMTPFFGGQAGHDASVRMRFVFGVDDFGETNVDYRRPPATATAADITCNPATPAVAPPPAGQPSGVGDGRTGRGSVSNLPYAAPLSATQVDAAIRAQNQRNIPGVTRKFTVRHSHGGLALPNGAFRVADRCGCVWRIGSVSSPCSCQHGCH
jgi:hypothetical protein